MAGATSGHEDPATVGVFLRRGQSASLQGHGVRHDPTRQGGALRRLHARAIAYAPEVWPRGRTRPLSSWQSVACRMEAGMASSELGEWMWHRGWVTWRAWVGSGVCG